MIYGVLTIQILFLRMSALVDNNVLPDSFIDLMKESLDLEAVTALVERVGREERLTSIRVNPFKIGRDVTVNSILEGLVSCKSNLNGESLNSSNSSDVKWSRDSFYLAERPKFTLDPLFHAGAYYVQEASSMYMNIVGEAIERVVPEFFSNELRALDLCAAPGGKSTHLTTLLNDNSILVANEVIKSRSVILADNIAKWGRGNVVVTNNDPQDFSSLDEAFHLIVVDAPCSGEGMFTKDIAVVDEWSLDNVNLCSLRQQRILSDVWGALKPGGFIVYSTCTYNHFENDDNVKFIVDELGAEFIALDDFVKFGGIKTKMGGVQFVPGLVEGEGQFVALLRKRGCVECENLFLDSDRFGAGSIGKEGRKSSKREGKRGNKVENKRGNYKDKRGSFSESRAFKGDITISDRANRGDSRGGNNHSLKNLPTIEGLVIEQKGEFLKGYPAHLERVIKFFESKLKIVLSGVAIANIKGKDFAPHADFALWQGVGDMLQSGSELPMGIVAWEVSREQAIDFLAKEPLVFSEAPIGYLMLVYKGVPLGFVKNLGNRTNSLLPMARRIRNK